MSKCGQATKLDGICWVSQPTWLPSCCPVGSASWPRIRGWDYRQVTPGRPNCPCDEESVGATVAGLHDQLSGYSSSRESRVVGCGGVWSRGLTQILHDLDG